MTTAAGEVSEAPKDLGRILIRRRERLQQQKKTCSVSQENQVGKNEGYR